MILHIASYRDGIAIGLVCITDSVSLCDMVSHNTLRYDVNNTTKYTLEYGI